MDPVVTPDGQSVVFASGTSQPLTRDLFIASLDGESQQQLTDRPLNISWQGTVSPDGTKIAYVVEKEGNSDIHVMNVDGTGNRNITNTNKGYWSPTWSPDSKRIVVTSRDTEFGNLELVELEADGSDKKQLTELGYNTNPVAFTPDGEHLLFGLDPGLGSPVLCSIRSDGSDFKTYAEGMILTSTPMVAPDGTVLFGAINESYQMTVYTVKLGKDEPPQRVVEASFALSPTLSPDGSRFAYVARGENDRMQIFEANLDGSDLRAVTDADALHSSPCYTPDGNSLVYLSDQDGKKEVYRKQLH